MNIFKYLAFVFLALGCSSEQGGKKPNIIIIMSDDMGFSDLSCYGGEIPTPHIWQ